MKHLLLVLALAVIFSSCTKQDNPVMFSASERPATETLVYEQLGLVDSVVSIPGVSEVTHVTNLGSLDYSGASMLRIKYSYFVSGDSSGIYANDVCLFSGGNNIYHSGSYDPVDSSKAVEHIVQINPLAVDVTKLRLTVYYSCTVISIRDLQVYKY